MDDTRRIARRRILALAKALLGCALLAFLLMQKDTLHQLRVIFGRLDTLHVVILFVIAMLLNLIGSIKWSLFLRGEGATVTLPRLFSLYLVGRFFSNFLPTMVGGDVARSYLLGQSIQSQSRSAVSVILERSTGLVGLIIVVLASVSLNRGLLASPIIAGATVAGTVGAAILVLSFLYPAWGLAQARRLSSLPVVGRAASKATDFIEQLVEQRHQRRALILSLLCSVGFHLATCVNVYAAAISIDFHPRFLDVMVITPVILLLTMIPVSPNNIGWWEWCFSTLLVSAGGTASEGLAVGLVLRAVNLLSSLLGGLLFLRLRSHQADEQPAPPPPDARA